ncbi:hypothetical protein [Streptomyces sp. ODS28]|uniref:hypothetical protein n=1 Tax=Streptomyces sp. ODS28 TaxID=3136688 RepID=UPI0031E5BDD7
MRVPEDLKKADRPDFERILDQTLESEEVREAVQRAEEAPDTDQLRSGALGERAAIASVAAREYRDYRRLRARKTMTLPSPRATGSAARTGGVLPALGVLVPSLTAVAAVLFLLLGLVLRLAGAQQALAGNLVTVGLIAAAVALVTVLVGLLWVLTAAVRNGSAPERSAAAAADPEVARAREAWQRALLERGLRPYVLRRCGQEVRGEETRGGEAAATARGGRIRRGINSGRA